MDKADQTKSFTDECVIYYSKKDKSWIAHSLRTDQLGYGECVVDALVDLIVCTRNLLKLHQQDPDVEIFSEAPQKIQDYRKKAKPLPKVLLEIALDRLQNRLPYPTHSDVPHGDMLTTKIPELQEV